MCVSSRLRVVQLQRRFMVLVFPQLYRRLLFFFFQAEDGIRDHCVTGVQTCALPILTATSLCARIVNVPAFRGIHGATCNFNNYDVHPFIGIQMDSTGTLNDIHIEGTDIGIGVGVSAAGTGAMLQNIYGGGWNIHTLVRVFSGREILLTGLVSSTTPVLLAHNGRTIRKADLAFYVVHNAGRPPAPSTIWNMAVASASAAAADAVERT